MNQKLKVLYYIHQIILLFAMVFSTMCLAESTGPQQSHRVTMIKGTAVIYRDNQSRPLRVADLLTEGDSVSTGQNGYVDITLQDGSIISLGPESKLDAKEIGNTTEYKSSLFGLLMGKMKVIVTKSIQDWRGQKPKLMIQTKGAVMGVRGTEFLVQYTPETMATSLVTFEGNVGLSPGSEYDANRVTSIATGQFSAIQDGQSQPTDPVRVAPVQVEQLRTAASGAADADRKANALVGQTTVPVGVDPMIVSANISELKKAISDSFSRGALDSQNSAETKSFVQNLTQNLGPNESNPSQSIIKDGGFVDLRSGQYFAPPPGSAYDPVQRIYLPPQVIAEQVMSMNEGGAVAENARKINLIETPMGTSSLNAAGQSQLVADASSMVSKIGVSTTNRESSGGPSINTGGSSTNGGNGSAVSAGANLGGVPFWDGARPMYPVYDPSMCPPYCDPRYEPGTYAGQPYRVPRSLLSIRVGIQ